MSLWREAVTGHPANGTCRRAIAVVAVMALVSVAATAQQGTPTTPTTVKEVMVTLTGPSADVIFMAAGEPPQNDQQWAAVRKGALALAESGRLLMTAERARDRTTWIDMAREMVAKTETAMKAADRRNAEALSEAGDDLYTTCETCHTRYSQP